MFLRLIEIKAVRASADVRLSEETGYPAEERNGVFG